MLQSRNWLWNASPGASHCWSPTWTQLWHIWSSGSSSCVRTGCRRWPPMSNAILQCFSCVLWPHLPVGMDVTRIRHVNCWTQLAKLHKFLYPRSKVHHWDLHSMDHCCVLTELLGLAWRKVPWSPSNLQRAPLPLLTRPIPKDNVCDSVLSSSVPQWPFCIDFLALWSLLLKCNFLYVVNNISGLIKSQHES